MNEDMIRLIEEGLPVILTGKGISMWPMLKPGKNLVKLVKNDENPKKYDVVLFKDKNRFILHRIIDIKDNKYTMSGDNTILLEENIDRSQIIAKLDSFVPDVNRFKDNNYKWISVDNYFYKIYVVFVIVFAPIRRLILKKCYKILSKKVEHHVGKEGNI